MNKHKVKIMTLIVTIIGVGYAVADFHRPDSTIQADVKLPKDQTEETRGNPKINASSQKSEIPTRSKYAAANMSSITMPERNYENHIDSNDSHFIPVTVSKRRCKPPEIESVEGEAWVARTTLPKKMGISSTIEEDGGRSIKIKDKNGDIDCTYEVDAKKRYKSVR